jgi:hypothetical protein
MVFDRMLARLFAVFGDAMTLKGGVVLELRLERARTTKDIDLRVVGSPGVLLARMQEAGRQDLGDFMTFEIRPDRRHAELNVEGLKYGGRRFRAEARLAGKIYGATFGIDVALAEPFSGEIESFTGSDILAFAGIPPTRLRIYPVEAHVAEKLHALTLPRSRPNSRVKDLPDLALLASIRPLDGGALRAAIDQTFASRGTHALPDEIPDPPEHWEDPYSRMAAVDDLPWSDLTEVLNAVRQFLNPVLSAPPDPGTWAPGSSAWQIEQP